MTDVQAAPVSATVVGLVYSFGLLIFATSGN